MNLQIRQCEITDAKAIHDLNLRVIKRSFHKVSEHCVAWHIVSAQGFYSLASTAIFKDCVYRSIVYLIHRLS